MTMGKIGIWSNVDSETGKSSLAAATTTTKPKQHSLRELPLLAALQPSPQPYLGHQPWAAR